MEKVDFCQKSPGFFVSNYSILRCGGDFFDVPYRHFH